MVGLKFKLVGDLMNRKVLDISHHNEVSSWTEVKNAGIVGIIHKATEGTSFVDSRYKSRESSAIAAGLLWGAYHFANDSSPEKQVDHFLRTVGVKSNFLYALDWEEEPNGKTMRKEQAREFLQILETRTNRKGVVYSGNLAKEELGNSVDKYFGEHRLWLAHYSNTPIWQKSWQNYWLWQYSDGVVGPQPHGCPGVSGEVDTNSWDSTDEELRNQWSGVKNSSVARVQIVTSGNVEVYVNGVLV